MHWLVFAITSFLAATLELQVVGWSDWTRGAPETTVLFLTFFVLWGKRSDLIPAIAWLAFVRASMSLDRFGWTLVAFLVASALLRSLRHSVPKERRLVQTTLVFALTLVLSVMLRAPSVWRGDESSLELALRSLDAAVWTALCAAPALAILLGWSAMSAFRARSRVFG